MAPRSGREPGHDKSSDPDTRARRQSSGGFRRPTGADRERLLEAASSGDADARQSLTQTHLDWVLRAAEARADRGLSQGDLFQEGTIGLIEAIGTFHDSGRDDFEAYALERVADRMEQAIVDEEKAVRDGEMLIQAAEDYERAEISARQRLGRAPTDRELAQKLEWSLERTVAVGEMVVEARRRHDEELLAYLEPGDVDFEGLIDERLERNGD